jgi:hypothetical protein
MKLRPSTKRAFKYFWKFTEVSGDYFQRAKIFLRGSVSTQVSKIFSSRHSIIKVNSRFSWGTTSKSSIKFSFRIKLKFIATQEVALELQLKTADKILNSDLQSLGRIE